jgi:hypothetical protein
MSPWFDNLVLIFVMRENLPWHLEPGDVGGAEGMPRVQQVQLSLFHQGRQFLTLQK